MKKLILFLTISLQMLLNCYGQTTVSGGIFSNTTWNLAGSPYLVTDNVVVMTGVTLTISPGVVVKFSDTKGLEVRGDLQAIGTITDTIVFTSASTSPIKGIWTSISFWNNLSVDYIKISYAYTALVNTNFNVININHSRFYNNSTGLNYMGSTSSSVGSVDNSLFDNNTMAISTASRANHISGSIFRNNMNGLGYVYETLISGCTFTGHTDKAINGYRSVYTGNTVTSNNIGFYIKLFTGSVVQNNMIIDNNIGMQVRGEVSSPVTGVYNNTICSNTIYNVENTANISINFQSNCWCSNDSVPIANSIYDAYDNLSLGLIYFSPYLMGCSTLGLEEVHETSTRVFPNPFNQFTTIEFGNPANERHSLKVYNSIGQMIYSIDDVTVGQIRIEKGDMVNGLYFFQLNKKETLVSTGKFIVE